MKWPDAGRKRLLTEVRTENLRRKTAITDQKTSMVATHAHAPMKRPTMIWTMAQIPISNAGERTA